MKCTSGKITEKMQSLPLQVPWPSMGTVILSFAEHTLFLLLETTTLSLNTLVNTESSSTITAAEIQPSCLSKSKTMMISTLLESGIQRRSTFHMVKAQTLKKMKFVEICFAAIFVVV